MLFIFVRSCWSKSLSRFKCRQVSPWVSWLSAWPHATALSSQNCISWMFNRGSAIDCSWITGCSWDILLLGQVDVLWIFSMTKKKAIVKDYPNKSIIICPRSSLLYFYFTIGQHQHFNIRILTSENISMYQIKNAKTFNNKCDFVTTVLKQRCVSNKKYTDIWIYQHQPITSADHCEALLNTVHVWPHVLFEKKWIIQ